MSFEPMRMRVATLGTSVTPDISWQVDFFKSWEGLPGGCSFVGYPGLLFLARLKPSKLRNVRRHAARMRSRAKLVPSALVDRLLGNKAIIFFFISSKLIKFSWKYTK